MNTAYTVVRNKDGISRCQREPFELLDIPHHQQIVEACYNKFTDLPDPTEIIQYRSFDDVLSAPELKETTLVFIDGGVTKHLIDLGKAVVVVDGGIIKHQIACGALCADGGIVNVKPLLR